MSFTNDVKEDLINISSEDISTSMAEVEAMIRLSSEISIIGDFKISTTFSSMSILRRFIKLLKLKYKMEYEIESRVVNRLDNRQLFTVNIRNCKNMIEDFKLLYIKQFEDYNAEEIKAYLRGAFLVKGSVNDPHSKNSHLEISSSNDNEIILIQKMMNSFELNSRISKRKSTYISYIKSKQAIGDFLYLIGVSAKMEYYEDAIITKEIMATAKRSINLDLANQKKTNEASVEQLKVIEYIEYNYPLEKLDPKLLMVMKVRKENKEASLSELLDIIHENYDKELTKSGLNHRFRRLKEIMEEFKNKDL